MKDTANSKLLKIPEEKAYYEALKSVVERFGKFDDNVGVWVGYIPAKDNAELNSIGVNCKNCAFYQGSGVCQIVEPLIEEAGMCRLAAIPDQLVTKSFWKGMFLNG